MLSIVCTVSSYAPPVAPAVATTRAASPSMETVDDLKTLSTKLNPGVGYYNPITAFLDMDFWGQGQAATIGFLRHAELKHGQRRDGRLRRLHHPGERHPLPVGPRRRRHPLRRHLGGGRAGGPGTRCRRNSKGSIIGAIGFLEWFGENKYALAQSGETHYMRGGKPGFYPSFKKGGIPHPVPFDSFDLFGLASKLDARAQGEGALAETTTAAWR